jgi:hypothetical protein
VTIQASRTYAIIPDLSRANHSSTLLPRASSTTSAAGESGDFNMLSITPYNFIFATSASWESLVTSRPFAKSNCGEKR